MSDQPAQMGSPEPGRFTSLPEGRGARSPRAGCILTRVWRGEAGLRHTFWVWYMGMGYGLAVLLAAPFAMLGAQIVSEGRPLPIGEPDFWSIIPVEYLIWGLVGLAINAAWTVFSSVGVIRAARHHPGKQSWANGARVAILISVGLFVYSLIHQLPAMLVKVTLFG